MRNIIIKSFSAVFLLFFGYVFAVSLLEICGNSDKASELIVSLILTVLILAAAVFVYRRLSLLEDKLDVKTLNKIFVIVALVMLALQIIFIILLGYKPISDSRYVDTAARNFACTGSFDNMYNGIEDHNKYFSRFPNNWCILMLLSFIYRAFYLIFGSVPGSSYAVINLIAIHLAVFFMFLTAREIFKRKSDVVFSLFIILVLPVMYLYSPILYTDTLSMPFVAAAVYCFIRFMRSKKTSAQILWALLTSLLVGFGYSIKGSVGVLMVAFAIYMFLKRKVVRAISVTALLAAAIVLFNSLVFSLGLSLGISNEKKLEKYRMPTIHWVMMGMVGDGGFNKDEFRYTISFKSYDEKIAADKERIKEHINNYDLKGFSDHIRKKTAFTWSDGKYYSYHHLKSAENKPLRYFVNNGKKFGALCSAIHFSMLFLMLISFLHGFTKRHIDLMFMIRMLVFGLGLFLLIWETRSRYLINFVPLFVLVSADGMRCLNALIARLDKRSSIKN